MTKTLKVDLDLCGDLCALREYYGLKFGVDGCGWAPCEDCVDCSNFAYRKGSHPILDKIYQDGYEVGNYKGICDATPQYMWD